jgi:hypothetical protein
LQKRGRFSPSPFLVGQDKLERSYLVFASSFFSTGASAPGAPAVPSGPAVPALPSGPAGPGWPSGPAGAAGAGGGGGGAGSSFLPQPTTVKVRANNAIADNETNLFRISLFTSFPVTSLDLVALVNFYYISGAEFQVICGHIVPGKEFEPRKLIDCL